LSGPRYDLFNTHTIFTLHSVTRQKKAALQAAFVVNMR
jgi:hypothetical protein